jgi:GNAT superfamily N-acetyltransferase
VHPEPSPERAVGQEWIPYSTATHPLFAETIRATYEQSLDCPALQGRRSIEDVIKGHKGVGAFDPRHWLVLRDDGRPLAVLILAHFKDRGVLEVVYMGVVCTARGRHLGRALLWRANHIAQDVGAGRLTLAVDGSNEPALRLYQAFGFAHRATRRAFICTPAVDA